ncbi:MAG: endolytic transglycosylase MltG [Deltaproteobacteria bacterium]|nr:endolytic transglycosylase MltG [Deltaproteobacteria bacterium]
MKKQYFHYLAIGITGITVIIVALALWKVSGFIYGYPDRLPVNSSDEQVEFVVPRGASFNKIISLLHEKKIISKPLMFRLYTMLKSGDIKVQTGNYIFRRNFTPRQVIKTLKAGPIITLVGVTIPEGKNILEVSSILENAGFGKKEEFLKYIRDPDFVQEVGAKGDNLEGYLMPETYKFRKGTAVVDILKYLVKSHFRVWRGLTRKYPKEFRKVQGQLGFNSHKMLIMASLIEKETGVKKERPLISGVFQNRLLFPGFKPKFLQTDPTIIYGCTVSMDKSEACKKFNGRIRYIHLRDRDNLYNTYTHEGLPPGPICSPGYAAMLSVLKPDPSRYLYFVAKTPGGEHYFSETIEEHEKAVDRFIRKKGR